MRILIASPIDAEAVVRLAEEHEVAVLDCMAERLSPRAAEKRIDAFAPDAIVSLVGSVSWREDREFLAGQAARGRRIAVVVSVALDTHAEARRVARIVDGDIDPKVGMADLARQGEAVLGQGGGELILESQFGDGRWETGDGRREIGG